MTETWRAKAASVIQTLCMESYEQCNRLPNGQLRKRHVSYSVPALAEVYIDILNMHDTVVAEERAKALFLLYPDPKGIRF